MNREITDHDDTRRPTPERDDLPARAHGPRHELERQQHLDREPEIHRDLHVRVRGRDIDLGKTEARTAYEVGRFRVVSEADLGDADTARALESLIQKELARRVKLTAPGEHEALRLVVLTRLGKEVLDRAYGEDRQRFWSGLVKPREAKHDSNLYRMFQAEEERINSAGGRVTRVVLDYEFKREIYSALETARAREPEKNREAAQREVAAQHQLRVVDSKIPLPDLRVEYVTTRGEARHIDLELSSGHYKATQRAEKSRAGFQIYSLQSHAGGTPRGEELVREVLFR